MAWVVKCINKGLAEKKACRAIMSKYGNKVSPAVYSIDSRACLDSLEEEIKWCNSQGLLVKISITNTKSMQLFFDN